jgi:hypothetical protein
MGFIFLKVKLCMGNCCDSCWEGDSMQYYDETREDFIKRRKEYFENNRPQNNKYRNKYCGRDPK